MQTFADPLRRAFLTAGDRPAVVCGRDRLTFAETWSRCRRLAGGIRGLGLSAGDRVALLGANCHRYLEAYQAVPACGLVVVPLNTRHAEPELRYALEDSGARILLTDREPGALASVVERVVRLPEAYEALISESQPVSLGEGVYLFDRKKDMIVSGGENVYCTEVEEALYAHPAVLEAAVFGVPHPTWGEAVHAVVVLRRSIEVEELIAHCRQRIAGYKVPKSVDVRAEPLPKSGPGKILKRELREPFWVGRQVRIAGS